MKAETKIWSKLLSWNIEVARGMERLESLKIVHRDLAARYLIVPSFSCASHHSSQERLVGPVFPGEGCRLWSRNAAVWRAKAKGGKATCQMDFPWGSFPTAVHQHVSNCKVWWLLDKDILYMMWNNMIKLIWIQPTNYVPKKTLFAQEWCMVLWHSHVWGVDNWGKPVHPSQDKEQRL